MVGIFYKIYQFLYISSLKITRGSSFIFNGKISSSGFFKIEIAKNAKLTISGNITLKSGTIIGVRKNARLTIDDGCFFNRNCSIICREEITIGKNCLFGESVKIYDNDHKLFAGKIYKDEYITSSIVIEDECWIANDVNILKGSYIPKNTVVGAMSLVNKRLEQSGIYAGIPVIFKRAI